ncbi:MAG: AIR synthase-related protein [Wolinella sp.]
MYRTFNMGVGMVLCAPKANLKEVLEKSGGVVIGEVIEGSKGVELI